MDVWTALKSPDIYLGIYENWGSDKHGILYQQGKMDHFKKQKGDNELSIWRKAKVSARVVYAVPR